MLRTLLRQRKVRRYSAAEIDRMRASALVVLSFPKSGRTWHRVMFGYYLSRLAGAEPSEAMHVSALGQRLGYGPITYSHNNANFTDGLEPSHPSVANPNGWTGRRVLLIVRDPRDVLVSAWHHAKYRDRIYSKQISDFIRDPKTGIDKVLYALNRWNSYRHLAESFNVISYEQMHRLPSEALTATVRALGLSPDPRLVTEAVDFASFGNMKEYEKTGYLGDGRMGNRRGSEESAKVRSGRIGGFADHLSSDDLSFIAARSAALGDPFAERYR